jgi:hypothetical protein
MPKRIRRWAQGRRALLNVVVLGPLETLRPQVRRRQSLVRVVAAPGYVEIALEEHDGVGPIADLEQAATASAKAIPARVAASLRNPGRA